MTHSIRTICASAIALSLILAVTPADAHKKPMMVNRSLDTDHQPIVSRTDFVFDAVASPAGLAPGEIDRLTGWFDTLGLGYGDTITLDTASIWRNAHTADAVSSVVSNYGMLVSHDAAPMTVGHPPSGSVRVVVSRATARVDGCPDWSVGNMPDYDGAVPSNFGCASMGNLAAVIANPQDLIDGRSGDHSVANLSVKAIKTYRDATTTGAAGLKNESSQNAGSGGK